MIDRTSLSTNNNLVVLRNLMMERRPQNTLEVGMASGGSALVFTATHRDLGRSPVGQHISIDPFQEQEAHWDAAGLQIVEQAGLTKYMTFHGQSSAIALASLLRDGHGIDMCYIDGSHLFEDVFVDWYFLSKLAQDKGVLLFDDATDPHVRKVIRFIQTNMSESFRELDLQPYRPDKGGPKYRLGRLLGKTQLRAFEKRGTADRVWNAPFSRF